MKKSIIAIVAVIFAMVVIATPAFSQTQAKEGMFIASDGQECKLEFRQTAMHLGATPIYDSPEAIFNGYGFASSCGKATYLGYRIEGERMIFIGEAKLCDALPSRLRTPEGILYVILAPTPVVIQK